MRHAGRRGQNEKGGNLVKTILKSAIGAVVALAAGATQASASTCILFVCFGSGGTGDTGGAPEAPEIDVTQGFAALAILVCAVLFLRERFLRQRTNA